MSHLPERRRKRKNSDRGRRNSNTVSGSSSSSEKESSVNDVPVTVSVDYELESSGKTTTDTKGEQVRSKFSSYFPLTSGETVKDVQCLQDTQDVFLTSSDGGGGRVPSPSSASSVASARRLEWDSGADVGYNLHYMGDNKNDEKSLSTIERLALAQGRLAVFPERSEPEGKSGPTAVINTTTPGTSVRSTASRTAVAHSTPVDTSQIRSATLCTTKSENEITPITRYDSKMLLQNVNQSCSHSNAEGEGKNTVLAEDKGSVLINTEKEDRRDAEVSNLERTGSCSLVDLRPSQLSDEKIGPDLHRSQSDVNLFLKASDCKTQKPEVQPGIHNPHVNNLAMAAVHSASSSSVATIVNNRPPQRKPSSLTNSGKVSVSVQTDHNTSSRSGSSSQVSDTHLSSRTSKDRVMASSNVDRVLIGAESSEFVKGKKSDKTVSNLGIQTEVSKSNSQHQKEERKYEDNKCSNCPGSTCKGAHKKFPGQQRPDIDTLAKEQNRNQFASGVMKTIQSQATKCATNGSEESQETANASNINQAVSSGIAVETSTAIDSANSFEYVPGEIYQRHINNRPDTVKNVSPGEERPHSAPSDVTSACTKSDITGNGEVLASGASTLARDLERSVQMLQKLVENHKSDAALRKKLVRSVVDRLVSSNYDDDQDDDHERPNNEEVSRQKNDMFDTESRHEQFQRSSRSVGVGCSSKSLSSSNRSTQSQTPSTNRCTGQGYFSVKKARQMSLSTTSGSVSLPVPADSCTDATPGDDYYSSSVTNSSSKRNQMHWRHMKTLSEQEFDKQHSKSDESALKSQLLKFCETERGNQLSWIQFEIDHLSNLKQFLMGQKSLTRSLESLCENRKKLPTRQFTKCTSATQTSVRSGDDAIPSRSSPQNITTAGNGDNPKCHVHSRNVPNNITQQKLNSRGPSKLLPVNQKAKPHSQQAGAGILTEELIHTKHVDLVIDMKLKSGDRTLVSRTEKLELPGSGSGDRVALEAACPKTPITDESGSVESGRINVFVQTQKQAKTASQLHGVVSNFENLSHKENRQYVESSGQQNKMKRAPMCCCECKRELDLIAKAVKSAKENNFSKQKAATDSDTAKKEECTQCENLYRNFRVAKGRVINKEGSSRSTFGSSSAVVSDNSSHAVFYQDNGQSGAASADTDIVDNGSLASAKPVISAARSTNVRRKHLNMNGSKKPLRIDKGEQVNGHSLGAAATSDVSVQVTSDSLQSNYKTATGNRNGGAGDHLLKCDTETIESKQEENAHYDSKKKLDDSQLPVEIAAFEQKRQICPCCKRKVSEESVYTQPPQFLVNTNQQIACPCCYVLQKCSQKSERVIESPEIAAVPSSISNQSNTGKIDEINNTQKDNKENFDVNAISNSPAGDCKPFAYILAFEPATPNAARREDEKRRKSLEVIKVKVPSVQASKKGDIATARDQWGNFQKGKEGSNPINDENLGHAASFRNRGATELKIYKTTLQDLLRSRRPNYVQHAEERRHTVSQMTRLREQRLQECRNLLAAGLAPPPPPPPSSVASEVLVPRRRVFTQKEMKSLTKRHYRFLPETQNKNSERKRKQDFRTNRLMAEIFARKLQRRVLKGEVNLSNSVTVISSSA